MIVTIVKTTHQTQHADKQSKKYQHSKQKQCFLIVRTQINDEQIDQQSHYEEYQKNHNVLVDFGVHLIGVDVS